MMDDTTREQAAELLAETARRVEAGPWGAGWDGPCVLHHLKSASGATSLDSYLLRSSIAAIRREVQGSSACFNDAPGRTAEEVATACRSAKRWL